MKRSPHRKQHRWAWPDTHGSFARRAVRGALFFASIFFILSGCGGYYSAEIAGYIKDAESQGGINGAIIRVYADQPDAAADTGFIVETASMTSGGNAGYFSHKIVWLELFPAFGEEGDSGSVWLGITHDDYTEDIVHVQGIISETVNLMPDILLDRASFECPELTGEVIDVAGAGVNGVRIELDLASTTDDEVDYVTTTATIDGVDGTYRFQNIRWRDEDPDSAAADTETATVTVDDNEYDSTDQPTVLLASDQEIAVQEIITVTREPRIEFETTVQGRCIDRYITTNDVQDIGARGVEVTLTYVDDDGAHTLYDQTDAAGAFAFFVQWTDSAPRNYDGTATDDTDDPTVPEGEDGLYVQIQYGPPFDTVSLAAMVPAQASLDITGGDSGVFDSTDFALKTWINPNYLPDAVIEH